MPLITDICLLLEGLGCAWGGWLLPSPANGESLTNLCQRLLF